MNIPQGPWYIDDLLTFTVVTTRFDTGVATDADAVPAWRVYEDETGTAILNGNMALLDSGNTAGFYSEQITLSAANGFEVGKTYSIYVGATVNSVAGASSGGFKVIATPVAQTGDSFARLGAPAGASISADIAAIEAQTDDIGVAGAGLTAIPWNAAWDAEVQSEVADALAVYDPPTNAEMEARTIAAADYSQFDPTADEVESGITYQESLRLSNAALGGKASGLETTNAKYRDLGDSKDRIDATVDADGNRTAVTLDLS